MSSNHNVSTETSRPVAVPYFVARASMYGKEGSLSRQNSNNTYTSSCVNTTWNCIPGVGPLPSFNTKPSHRRNPASSTTTVGSTDVDCERGKGSQLVVSSPGMGLEMCYAELIVQLLEEQQQQQQQQQSRLNSAHPSANQGYHSVTSPLLNVLLVPDQLLGNNNSSYEGANSGDAYLERLGLCIEIAANDTLHSRGLLRRRSENSDDGETNGDGSVAVDVRCALSGMLPVQRSQLYKPSASKSSTSSANEPISVPPITKSSVSKGTPFSRFQDLLVASHAPKRAAGLPKTKTQAKNISASTTLPPTPTPPSRTSLSVMLLPISYFVADVLHKRISLELVCTSIVLWIPHDLKNISGMGTSRLESLLASMAFVLQLGTEAQTERKRIIDYYATTNAKGSSIPSSASVGAVIQESSIPAGIRASVPTTGGSAVLGRTLPHLTVMSDSPSSTAALFGIRNTLQLQLSDKSIPTSSSSSTSSKKVGDLSVSYPRLKRLQELFNLSALNLFPWFRYDILQIRKAAEQQCIGFRGEGSSASQKSAAVATSAVSTSLPTWSIEELYVKCPEEERYARQELLAILSDLLVEAKGSLRRVEMEDERARIEEETLREEQRLAAATDQFSSSEMTRPNGAQIRRSAEQYVSRRYRSLFSGVSLSDVSLDDLVHAQRTGLQWRLRDFVASVSRNSIATSIEVQLLSQHLAHSRGSTFTDAVQVDDEDAGFIYQEFICRGAGVETIYQRLRTCAQSIAALLDVTYLYRSIWTSASRSRYGSGNVCFQLEDMVCGYHAEYTRAVLGIVMPTSGGRSYGNQQNSTRRGTHAVKAFTGISAGAGADLVQFSAAIWTTSARFAALRERLWGLLASSVVTKSLSGSAVNQDGISSSSPTEASSSMLPPTTPTIKRTLTLCPTLIIDSRFTLIGEFLRNWIHTMLRRWNAWMQKKVARSTSTRRTSTSTSSSGIVCPSALLVVPDEYTLRKVKEYLLTMGEIGAPCNTTNTSFSTGSDCRRNCIYHPPNSGTECPSSVMACMEFCRCLVRLASKADQSGGGTVPRTPASTSTTTTHQQQKVTMLTRPTSSNTNTTTLLTKRNDIGEKRPRDDNPDGEGSLASSAAAGSGGGYIQLPPTFGDAFSGAPPTMLASSVAERDEHDHNNADDFEREDGDVAEGGGGESTSEEGVGTSQISVLRGIIDLVTFSQLQEEQKNSTEHDKRREPDDHSSTKTASAPSAHSSASSSAQHHIRVPTPEESREVLSMWTKLSEEVAAPSATKKADVVRTLWAKASELLRCDPSSTRGDGGSSKSKTATVQSVRRALLHLHHSVLLEISRRPILWFGSRRDGVGGISRDLEEAARCGGGASLYVYEDAVAKLFCRVLFPCVQVGSYSGLETCPQPPSVRYSVAAQSSSTVVFRAHCASTPPAHMSAMHHQCASHPIIDPPQTLVAITTAESLTVSHLARMLQSKLVTVKTGCVEHDYSGSTTTTASSVPVQEVISIEDSSTDDEGRPNTKTSATKVEEIETEPDETSLPPLADATTTSNINPTISFCHSTVRRIVIFEPNILLARKIETAKGVAMAAAMGGNGAPATSSMSVLHDPLSRGITKVVLLRDASELPPRRAEDTAVDVEEGDDILVDVDAHVEEDLTSTTASPPKHPYPRITVLSSVVDQSIDLAAFEVLMKAKRDMPSAIMVSLAARRALLNLLKGSGGGDGGGGRLAPRTNQPVNTQRRLLTAAVQDATSSSSSVATATSVANNLSFTSSSSSALVVVDDREFRATLPFFLFLSGVKLTPLTLLEGDYILSAHCALERKSFADFNQSIQKGRLQEQLVRLSRKYAYPVILIEDSNYPSCIGAGGGGGGGSADLSTISSSSRNPHHPSGGGGDRSREEIVASTIKALMNGTLPYIAGSGGADDEDGGNEGGGDLGVGRLQQVYRFRQTSTNGGSSGSVAPFIMSQLYKRIVSLMTALPSVIWLWSRSPEHSAQMIAHLKTGGGNGDLTASGGIGSGGAGHPHRPQLLSHSIGTSNPDISSAALTVKASESEADATRAAVRMIVRFPGVNRRNVIKLMSAARSLAGLATMSKDQLIAALDDDDVDNNTYQGGAAPGGWNGKNQHHNTHRHSNGARLYHFLHTSLHTE